MTQNPLPCSILSKSIGGYYEEKPNIFPQKETHHGVFGKEALKARTEKGMDPSVTAVRASSEPEAEFVRQMARRIQPRPGAKKAG